MISIIDQGKETVFHLYTISMRCMKNLYKVSMGVRTSSKMHHLHFETKHFCFALLERNTFSLLINLTAGGHYPAQMSYFTDIISKWWSRGRPENEFYTATFLSTFQRPWKFYWRMSAGINESIFYYITFEPREKRKENKLTHDK